MKEGWEIKKLGDVCEVIAGQSPKSQFYNEDEIGLPFYQGKKEFQEKYIGEPTKWTSKITKEAVEDDILMSVRAPVGPVNFATQKCCIGRGLAAIRSSKLINKDYCFYYLQSKEDELIGNSGAVFNSINKTQIGNIQIPIPPLTEQKQIVSILDKACTAIDQAKANIEKNIENAKELFQSKLNDIFSQKGDGWEEKRFKEVCVLQRGFDLPKRLRKKGNYDLVTSSGVKDSHAEYKVEGPGVVTGRSGSIGNVFYIENNFWPLNTALYIKDFNGNDEKYVYYFLKNFDLSKYSTGTGVPTLNRNFVHDKNVLSTNNIDKQKEVVKTLDSLTVKVDEIQRFYNNKLNELEELKKSILQKAFAGELTSPKGTKYRKEVRSASDSDNIITNQNPERVK